MLKYAGIRIFVHEIIQGGSDSDTSSHDGSGRDGRDCGGSNRSSGGGNSDDSGRGDCDCDCDCDNGRDCDNNRGGPMIPPGGMVAAEESATVGPSGTSAV